MKIEILANAKSVEAGDQVLQNVKEALARTEIEAEVHIYHDVHKMIDHRVHIAPALMIDDTVRIAGRIPDTKEIISIFAECPRYYNRLRKVA